MSEALGTLAAALIVVAVATAIGAGILAASGRREWSWTAPAIGLAAATVLAWWAVRLPGEGLTALIVLVVAAIAGAALAAARLDDLGGAGREGAPVLLVSALAVLIPFVAEGHFGVLGTGFNVDMSQHLFAADWIADPVGRTPGLYEQGYPLGPHALAVAVQEVSGNPVTAFSGLTIALPVVAALTALAGLREWPWWRATIAAALTAFAYLVASYLAQGSFKELFEVCFLIGLALWLRELADRESSTGWRTAIPVAVLAAGALYAYSTPGLAWLAGTLIVWAVVELARRRAGARAALRRAAPAVFAGLLLLGALAAPEIDRILEFGGSVGTVSEAANADPRQRGELLAAGGDSDGGGVDAAPEFDDDLGNLFGQISPLEAFGVWPSGDFRVAPGDGAIPAAVFYAGALLGALALAIGLSAALRAGETALLSALVAAAMIWIAARIGSTPYTTAKALALLAPVVMLIAARGVVRPGLVTRPSGRPALLSAAVGAAFVVAAALSTALVLANAPVGPSDYTPGVRDLSDRFAGRATLLLAPDDVIADERGEEFFGWEIREAGPACVAGEELAEGQNGPPAGFDLIVTVGTGSPPFPGLRREASSAGVTLWEPLGYPAPSSDGPDGADADAGCAELIG